MDETESGRLAGQARLDAATEPERRNRNGQYATPGPLAEDMVCFCWEQWRRERRPVRFPEPALGTGSIFSALTRTFPADLPEKATGIEADRDHAAVAERLWGHHGLAVRCADFTELPPRAKLNLLITNPPYVRHHHLVRPGGSPRAPFLCTYMGRNGRGRKPFRFLWNQSQATAHNVYLLLYPKGELQGLLKQKPGLHQRVFAALQSLDTAMITGTGRVYGGGLFKMEPKKLAAIPAQFILGALAAALTIKHAEQRSLFGASHNRHEESEPAIRRRPDPAPRFP